MANFIEVHFLIMAVSFFIVIAGYAEIHFRIPGLPSKIYKKEPEILFDLPHRATSGEAIPLFLFVKDAHLFPVQLKKATVIVQAASNQNREFVYSFLLNCGADQPFFSQTLWIETKAFPEAGSYLVSATLTYKSGNAINRLYQDNYIGIPKEPFIIKISETPLPTLPGWKWGDLHIHSNFTNDAVEFGAPVLDTAVCAKTLGLDFIAITDHSFDLDDDPLDYKIADPHCRKWTMFRQACMDASRSIQDICIIPGEEVSVGNSCNQNVHCLLLGNTKMYPGSGDSGDNLWQNQPTLTLPELAGKVRTFDPAALIIAAHPFDEPPISQRHMLNRGHWHAVDLNIPELHGWQILNGRTDRFFANGLSFWKKQLLGGKRIAIVAGTDAHGNFNNFRQVSIPLLKMIYHRQQLLGQTRTGIYCPDILNVKNTLDAIRQKKVVISNGPAAEICIIQDESVHHCGETMLAGSPFSLQITAVSSREFGKLTSIHVFTAKINAPAEQLQQLKTGENSYSFREIIQYPNGLPGGYIRLEIYTQTSDNQPAFCITNPIWIS